MTLKSDPKFKYTLTLWFQNWHEELSELLWEHPKVQKIVLWWTPKYMFQLENFTGNVKRALKGDVKFKGKLTCGLKNDTRNFVNFHARSRKFENLHIDGLLLSKAYKVLDEKSTEELCLMTLVLSQFVTNVAFCNNCHIL